MLPRRGRGVKKGDHMVLDRKKPVAQSPIPDGWRLCHYTSLPQILYAVGRDRDGNYCAYKVRRVQGTEMADKTAQIIRTEPNLLPITLQRVLDQMGDPDAYRADDIMQVEGETPR